MQVKRILALTLVLLMLASVMLPVAFAWLTDTTTTSFGMTSYIHKSYFESGDGTSATHYSGVGSDEGCAFEIHNPLQFYYFAWLQYLGYFNLPVENTTTINQVYFYLSDDLDMTGYVLPPIGTTTFPFLGNFDGNNHVISNLTVQNVASATVGGASTLYESPVNSLTGLEICGVFGVVGSTGTVGRANASQENQGAYVSTSGYGYTYSTSVNAVKNLSIDGITIKTETSTALVGTLAGYVNGGSGIITNVSSSIDNNLIIKAGTTAYGSGTPTSNYSDYGIIGCCTANTELQQSQFKIHAPIKISEYSGGTGIGGGEGGGQNAGNNWGGSVDMKSIDDRMYHLLNKNLQTYNVTSSASALATIQTGHGVKTSTGYHWYYSDSHNSFNSFDSGSSTYYSKNPNSNSVVYRLGGSQNVRASSSPTSNTGRPLFPVPQSVLPLAVDDENGYATLPSNTGYIIGGSTGSGSYGGQTTVRAGSYGINYIGNSLSSSGTTSSSYVQSQLEVITISSTTYSASNFGRIKDQYNQSNASVASTMSSTFSTRTVEAATLQKYSEAREALDGILSGSAFVHGLHFTGSTVSKTDVTTLTTAYINNQTFSNYELPRHSLDFHLKEAGYINFFAGSYRTSTGTNSDSFFSLNIVKRDGNQKLNSNNASIKEISKIYRNTNDATKGDYPYVYLCNDSTYSTGSTEVSYTVGELVFDCQFLWNAPPIANALYYIEIPVNAGEYAMGSHSGKANGTYLIYLDISASSGDLGTIDGTKTIEVMSTTTYDYEYPEGVTLEDVGATLNASISTTGTHTIDSLLSPAYSRTEYTWQKEVFTASAESTVASVTIAKVTKIVYDSSGAITANTTTEYMWDSGTSAWVAKDTPVAFADLSAYGAYVTQATAYSFAAAPTESPLSTYIFGSNISSVTFNSTPATGRLCTMLSGSFTVTLPTGESITKDADETGYSSTNSGSTVTVTKS